MREGEVTDIAFGDMLCVGFDAETGESRDIAPEERRPRVMERFGSTASVASGSRAQRLAYEAHTGRR